MSDIAIDTETSIGKTIHGPTFRDPDNDIYTQMYDTGVDAGYYIEEQGFKRKLAPSLVNALSNSSCIVGVNLGFDLSYLWQDGNIQEFVLRGGGIWDCFTGDTEILTEHGWCKFSALDRVSKVAQYANDGSISFVKPLHYIDKDYVGPMLHVTNGRHINHLSTLKHNRVVRTYRKGNLKIVPANSITSLYTHNKAVLAGEHDGVGVEYTDNELRLIVAIQADSYVTKHGNAEFEFKKLRKACRLRNLLRKTGHTFKEYVSSRNSYRFMVKNILVYGEGVKSFSNIDPTLLTLKQKNVILDELKYWDGFSTGENSFEYYSYNNNALDKIQTIAILAGRRALKNKNRLSIVKKDFCVQNSLTSAESLHNGRVYCVSVPTSMIVVRYKGCVQITGNCQVAEYLLTGQQHTFASLAELQEKHLGEKVKPNRISYLFSKGIGADRIVKARDRCTRLYNLYYHYCMTDVQTPLLIKAKQMEIAEREGMVAVIELYNDYLLAIINMTCTGINIDMIRCEQTLRDFNLKYIDYLEQAVSKVKSFWSDERLPEFNINSPDHKSAALFGGRIKCSVRREVGLFKNGNVKYKKIDEYVEIKGFRVPSSISRPSAKDGFFSTDDKVMKKVLAKTKNQELKDYCKLQQQAMMYKKAGNTYCQAFLDRSTNGILYPNFNNTATKTGRLSSSEPNMQNVTSKGELGKPLHKIFVAPDGWECVSIDFSQLEKWVQAWVSGDQNLTEKLLAGFCLHCVTLSEKEQMPYEEVYSLAVVKEVQEWVDKRKNAKPVSFQMDYGAMPPKVAESTGLPLSVVEELFALDKELYPQKHSFFGEYLPEYIENHSSLSYACNIPSYKKGNHKDSARFAGEIEILPVFDNFGNVYYNDKNLRRVGYWQNEYGKKYHFLEKGRQTKWGLRRSFSFTQPKNYPNQGGGGDIQAATSAALLKTLILKKDRIKMVNEIHDSKWFYVRKDVLDKCLRYLKETIEDVPKIFLERFGIKVPFKFPVGIEVGPNFADMQKYEFK